MRRVAIAVGLALVAGACSNVTGTPPDTSLGEWELVFNDEFNGASLDSTHWHPCYWWDDDGCTIITNNELEWYQRDQVTVSDGLLTLRAEPGFVEATNGNDYEFVSGMVSTGRSTFELDQPPRFAFEYGFVEARVSVPEGAGIWPAIWMLPATNESTPEIDILEVYADPGVAKMRLHWEDSDGDQRAGHETSIDDLHTGFHTFGLEWTPDELRWFIDGREVWRVDENVPQEPMYLLLNLAVGGDAPGPPDSSTSFPADFVVDWVRIWQR